MKNMMETQYDSLQMLKLTGIEAPWKRLVAAVDAVWVLVAQVADLNAFAIVTPEHAFAAFDAIVANCVWCEKWYGLW